MASLASSFDGYHDRSDSVFLVSDSANTNGLPWQDSITTSNVFPFRFIASTRNRGECPDAARNKKSCTDFSAGMPKSSTVASVKILGTQERGRPSSAAALAGIPDGSTVFLIERKRGHVPRLDTVEKIALALGLSPGFLAFGLSTESHEAPAATEGLRALGVAARVQEARIAQGLSVLALAKAAGLSHTAVGNVERGTMPSLETAERLAVALAVSPAWLAFGEGPRALPPRRRTTRAAASASP